MFKGEIARGQMVARLQADFSNAQSALLVLSFQPIGPGNADMARDSASPGGTATATVQAPGPGMLTVMISVGGDRESGRLVVSHNGSVQNDEAIMGPTVWTYSVV